MFDAITEKPKPRRWQTAVIIGSAAVHAAAIAAVVVGAMWQVEKLDVASGVDVTFSVPPPPGESAPPPAASKLDVRKEEKQPPKVKPDVPVQPTVVKDDPTPKTTGGGGVPDGTGTDPNSQGTDPTATGSCLTGPCTGGGGEEKPECEDGEDNDSDGFIDAADPACKEGKSRESLDPVAEPPIVPPGVAKGLRLSGNENIYPPEMVRIDMLRAGKDVVQATVQLCVSKTGTVSSVKLLKKTGFSAYDDVLSREIREWRYKPYTIGGRPSPMCTVAMIVYRMKR